MKNRAKLYIFIIPFIIYMLSPIFQVSDSSYTLLLTQNIIDHARLDMSRYNIKLTPSINAYGSAFKFQPYHFERYGDRVYYMYPVGSSVLSIPFVKLFNMFGISAITDIGSYDGNNEAKMQKIIASFLAASTVWMIFLIAGYYLNWFGSFIISLAAAFGTAIFSTAACGLWSHTWSLSLGTIVLLLFVRMDHGNKVDETVLGSLLMWSYFVRPTNVIMIIICIIYLITTGRIRNARLLLTVAVWLLCFVFYSWITFDKFLPTYYTMSNFEISGFFKGLAGITISPARGLFVYSPIFLITLYLSVRSFSSLCSNRLFMVAAVIVSINILVISSFQFWWGGSCYGPKYLTDIIPWLIYMTIVSVSQYSVVSKRRTKLTFVILSITLIGISTFNNFPGAYYGKYFNWYDSVVQNGRFDTDLLWNWRKAPFIDLLSSGL